MNAWTPEQLGWQPFFAQQVDDATLAQTLQARVSAHHGGQVELLSELGVLSVPAALLASGDRVPHDLAVGDWLLLDREHHRGILRLDRKTLLSRKAAGEAVKSQPIAANVDTAFVVSSCNQDFNLSRIERYLALVLESGCTPVVVLTKADLTDDAANLAQQVQRSYREAVVETLDARDPSQATVLEHWCRTGQTAALLGSSGVGKSTLANALGARDLLTQSIRAADGKGRHTTTARSMHRLHAGGWLIDNPGMRELQLPACAQGVADLFDDLLQFAAHCRFRNCRHAGDDGCAVEQAVADGRLDERRLVNYLKLQSEQERNSATLAERRERDKSNGRMYKRVIREKRSLRELQ